jgi:NAD(P)-dependent dehydrogenase (short-subunit alcohol dehydrogenase family)
MSCSFEIYRHGLFNIAQRTLPHLLAAVPSAPHPPSLIVTGATASLRGSANFSTFAAGKFAQRALVQSLAREFGKQGVHVSLAVIDGGINVPRLNDVPFNGGAEDGKLSADAVSVKIFLFLA